MAVSPHIRDKQYDRDVLVFANPKKLRDESAEFIKDPSQQRPKAFWEILGKRTNESVHLLDGETISVIMRALSIKTECEDILSGVCRVVSDDIKNRPNLVSRFSRFEDSVHIAETVIARLGFLDKSALDRLVNYWADTTCEIATKDEIVRLVRILSDSKPEETEIANLLYRKLLHRWVALSGGSPQRSTDVSLCMLLDTVNYS